MLASMQVIKSFEVLVKTKNKKMVFWDVYKDFIQT